MIELITISLFGGVMVFVGYQGMKVYARSFYDNPELTMSADVLLAILKGAGSVPIVMCLLLFGAGSLFLTVPLLVLLVFGAGYFYQLFILKYSLVVNTIILVLALVSSLLMHSFISKYWTALLLSGCVNVLFGVLLALLWSDGIETNMLQLLVFSFLVGLIISIPIGVLYRKLMKSKLRANAL